MSKKHVKFWLLGVAAIAILGGSVASFAGDDHGHGHAHEETEESHDDHGEEKHGHDHDDEHGHEGEEGAIHLSPEQIEASGITIAPVSATSLSGEITVPGRIVPSSDNMAQIVPKVAGTVATVKKNLGDSVVKGDILAEIESREMADAAAEYQAAARSEELARRTLEREKLLWEKKITAEQEYLNARNIHQEAAIKVELARQKLGTLGHDGKSLKGVSRFHTLRAPIDGRIIARDIVPGSFADTSKAAFTIANLSAVWVESAIPASDVAKIQEGQIARIINGDHETEGQITFLGPAIDPETGAAKAIITLDNPDGIWRPGLFVTAAIGTGKEDNALTVPADAIQTIEGKKVVFVRNGEGFEKRDITIGRDDGKRIEILSGVKPGENIAVTNTFTLKAELGKSEAEHSH